MCLFTGSAFRMCFFDFCTFIDCDFSKTDFMFRPRGQLVPETSFESSKLQHVNFCGATISECTFNDSDLYNSRFIGAHLDSTDSSTQLEKTFFVRRGRNASRSDRRTPGSGIRHGA
jgi:uncharacterized protein YjbI with pentapeptide repeats